MRDRLIWIALAIFLEVVVLAGERRRRQVARVLSVCGAAAAAAVLAAGCGSSSSSTSSSAATAGASEAAATAPQVAEVTGSLANVTWNLPGGEPNSLDPLMGLGYSPKIVGLNLCDTLFQRDPVTGKLVPGLVTSTSRPDPKTFVYELRDDVKFWDGNPLTADDVVFSLRRNMDPKVALSQYAYFSNVKSITATGTHEVTITFTKPDTLFEEALPLSSNSGISEAAVVKREGKSYGSPTGTLMCSGPYKLERWAPASEIVLVPNQQYWDQARVPKVDKLTFKFVVDTSAVTAALLAGELDGTTDVPATAIEPLRNVPSGHFAATAGPNQYQIRPIGGPLKDAAVRKALSLAIDRPAIAASIFHGLAKPEVGFYPPWTWTNYPEAVQKQFAQAQAGFPGATPDVDAAKAAFAAAGSPKEPIVIGLLGGDKVQQDIGAIVQSQAQKAGLNVQLKSLSATQYNAINTGPEARAGLDGMLASAASSVPDAQMLAPFFVLPGQVLNYIGYDNPSVTEKIGQARETFDLDKRAQLLIAAQEQFIGKDQIVIPIVDYDYLTFVNRKVGGFVPTFNNIYFAPWAASLGAAG